MPKHLIFDVDGTIADSFDLFLETIHTILGREADISAEETQLLRSMSIKQIMSRLNVKPWQLPKFVIKGRKEIAKNFSTVKAFDGMPSLIKSLSSKGHTLYIVSTNSKEAIMTFLERYELNNDFKHVYADIGLTGKAKILKKLLADQGIKSEDAIYIGDEVRDIEAARKSHIKVLSVTWGYATRTAITSNNPDFAAHTPDEIATFVQ